MEDSPAGLELLCLDAQPLYGLVVEDVDVASAIYQNSGKASSSPLYGKSGIQNQGIGAGIGHYFRVVGSARADGLLGPMHELSDF